MTKSLPYKLLVSTVFFAMALTVAATCIAQQRPLVVDDMFQLEEMHLDSGWGPFTLSPDGKWLAYVRIRPEATVTRRIGPNTLGGLDRGDIWITDIHTGKSQNITNGVKDSSGFWWPVWSPDGERLAMFSTKGNGNVRLWVLERATGQLSKLSERGVDQRNEIGLSAVWVSDDQLLFSVLPEGKRNRRLTINRQAAEVAMDEWSKSWTGKEVTASVLSSGVSLPYEPEGELVLVDLKKGTTSTIAAGQYRGISVSPDKRSVAYFRQIATPTTGKKKIQLIISSIQNRSESSIELPAGFSDPRVKWSLDSKEVAILEARKGPVVEERSKDELRHIYKYTISNKSLELVTGGYLNSRGETLRPLDCVWSLRNHLIIQAQNRAADSDSEWSKRVDWWLLESPGKYRNLTASMKSPPSRLLLEASGESFIAVADGDLWRITLDNRVPFNLTEKFEQRIEADIWPPASQLSENPATRAIVVRALNGKQRELFRIDLATTRITFLAKPTPQAEFIEFFPAKNMALFGAHAREGSYLWLTSEILSKPITLVEANTFLKGIAEGELRKVEYRSLDGQELKGWIIMPINYRKGTHYPLVTWVYAGNVVGHEPGYNTKLNLNHALNLQLLAARGYAVLIPSMPLKPYGEGSDPYLELTKGVLPAIDKAIELGIADPKRLAVLGHSYGGYSTYGLITQTHRFRAAVAMAGLTDLISNYGIFDARNRYDEVSQSNSANYFFRSFWSEGGQGRMANPPWKDMGRYLRNSPLGYVERVETPVMIIHGDLDFVSIQQPEQFFSALFRQGKRAEFVRYWGEGHVLSSPANIRDMWYRIYAWFDEFLDVSRDERGNMLFQGDQVKGRNGAPPLKPDDYAKFDQFQLSPTTRRNR